jgi:hypothetical protein
LSKKGTNHLEPRTKTPLKKVPQQTRDLPGGGNQRPGCHANTVHAKILIPDEEGIISISRMYEKAKFAVRAIANFGVN